MPFYDYVWAAEVYSQFEKLHPRVAFVNRMLSDKASRSLTCVSFSTIERGVIGAIQLADRTAHIWRTYKDLVKGTSPGDSEIYSSKALHLLACTLAKIGNSFLQPPLPMAEICREDRNTSDISGKTLDDAINSGIFGP